MSLQKIELFFMESKHPKGRYGVTVKHHFSDGKSQIANYLLHTDASKNVTAHYVKDSNTFSFNTNMKPYTSLGTINKKIITADDSYFDTLSSLYTNNKGEFLSKLSEAIANESLSVFPAALGTRPSVLFIGEKDLIEQSTPRILREHEEEVREEDDDEEDLENEDQDTQIRRPKRIRERQQPRREHVARHQDDAEFSLGITRNTKMPEDAPAFATKIETTLRTKYSEESGYVVASDKVGDATYHFTVSKSEENIKKTYTATPTSIKYSRVNQENGEYSEQEIKQVFTLALNSYSDIEALTLPAAMSPTLTRTVNNVLNSLITAYEADNNTAPNKAEIVALLKATQSTLNAAPQVEEREENRNRQNERKKPGKSRETEEESGEESKISSYSQKEITVGHNGNAMFNKPPEPPKRINEDDSDSDWDDDSEEEPLVNQRQKKI